MEQMDIENITMMNPTNNSEVSDENCLNKADILRKLKHIMYSKRFCGLCMENNHELTSIYNFLEIKAIYIEDGYVSIKNMLTDLFYDTTDLLATSYICNDCLEKAVQSYIFIENTKRSAKLIQDYVSNFHFKISLLAGQIDPNENGRSQYIIVVEPSAKDDKDIEGLKKEDTKNSHEEIKVKTEPTLIIDGTTSTLQIKQKQPNENDVLDNKTALNHQDVKPNGEIMCKICFKTDMKTQRGLSAHYKVHNRVKCRICHTVLLNADLQLHLKLHHRESVHSCDYCDEVNYTENGAEKHKKTHSFVNYEDGENMCVMCLKYFKESDIKTHLCRFKCTECATMPCLHLKYLTAYRKNVYYSGKNKCPDCDYVFTNKYSLIEHANIAHLDHHENKCDVCSVEYYSAITLQAHNKHLHSSDIFCKFCDQAFKDFHELSNHDIEKCKSDDREFKCNECEASFDKSVTLAVHKDFRHKDFPYYDATINEKRTIIECQSKKLKRKVIKRVSQCPLCKMTFNLKGDYMQHITDLHGPNYSCDECQENFHELKEFLLHHNEKHSESSVCNVCGKSFVEQRKLLYHMKYAHTKPEPCKVCRKMIKSVSMKSHLKCHRAKEDPSLKKPVDKSKAKRFICDVCGRLTATKELMTIHMYRHLKLKPYSCKVCGVTYSSKYQLTEHMIAHSEEKWHHCNICDRKLRHRIGLKKHMMLHSGERPHICDICGEGFITVNRLKEHKNRHSGKNLKCPLCWRQFYLVKNLRYHIKTRHWDRKGQPFDRKLVKGLTEEHDYIFQDGRLAVVE